MRTISQRTELDADAIAGLDGIAVPTAASQHARTGGFNAPLLWLAPALRLHQHPDDAMGIGPLKSLDGALERQRLGAVIDREGVMRQDWAGGSHRRRQHDCAKALLDSGLIRS